MMKPEIKKIWVEALNSGEYKQGQKMLCQENEDGTASFCCLGVLCDLAEKQKIVTHRTVEGIDYKRRSYGNERLDREFFLPYDVVMWAGLQENDPRVQLPESGNWDTLSAMNDEGKSFSEIAKAIEAGL